MFANDALRTFIIQSLSHDGQSDAHRLRAFRSLWRTRVILCLAVAVALAPVPQNVIIMMVGAGNSSCGDWTSEKAGSDAKRIASTVVRQAYGAWLGVLFQR